MLCGQKRGFSIMKNEQISVRVDHATKAAAEAVFSKLGLAPTEAVRLFYRQVALRRGLPFSVELPNAKTRAALDDLNKGKGKTFKTTEDFYADLGI
jgi:DNA-damage-inducible protein J